MCLNSTRPCRAPTKRNQPQTATSLLALPTTFQSASPQLYAHIFVRYIPMEQRLRRKQHSHNTNNNNNKGGYKRNKCICCCYLQRSKPRLLWSVTWNFHLCAKLKTHEDVTGWSFGRRRTRMYPQSQQSIEYILFRTEYKMYVLEYGQCAL